MAQITIHPELLELNLAFYISPTKDFPTEEAAPITGFDCGVVITLKNRTRYESNFKITQECLQHSEGLSLGFQDAQEKMIKALTADKIISVLPYNNIPQL